VLAILALAANAAVLVGPVSSAYAVRIAWISAGLAALTGTAAAARRVPAGRLRTAWTLWTAAAGFWLLGSLLEAGTAVAGVSSRVVPDGFWCLFMVLAIAGLAYRAAPGTLSFHVFLLDALPIALGMTAIAFAVGNAPQATWQLAFGTAFSATSALLALVALQLLVWMGFRAVNMWILVAGFVLTGAGGLTLPAERDAWAAADLHWSSGLWTLGMLLVALAALRRAVAPSSATRLVPIEREHAARALPAAAAILGLAVAAALAPDRSQLFPWLTVAAVMPFAVRTYLVWRANDAAQKELARLVYADALTELLNRRGLQQVLSGEAGRAGRIAEPLHVLLVDLDDFKAINDTLGHAVGDVALQEVAKAVRSSVRAMDHAARIGGDEFIVVLPEVRSAEAARVAERIRLAVSELVFSSQNHVARVTASLGLVQVASGAPSIDELLTEAHRVLRRAKAAGKNRVSTRGNQGGGAPAEAEVVADSLLLGDVLRAVKQPIVRLEDKSIAGYELLVRSTVDGYELPPDFFPLCSQANILTLVDLRCFQTCVEAADWSEEQLRYHVNLFPSTLLDLPIERLLAAFPHRRARLACCIEISEQQIVGDPSYLVPVVSLLKEEGLTFAIDDVGFGRSSLESLILLEPEVVKVDRQCIDGVASNLGRLRALKRLLGVAGALGADVIAEGIESEEDMRVLAKLGVPYGQGYLFGRPSEPEHIMRIAAAVSASRR
jgi:diguanylate cyclase (GGDEF)-like protein